MSFSKSAEIYQKEITNKPTFILMSVAEDGHIASIFLKSKALKTNKKVIFIDKKIKNYRRITVTLKYLKKKKIYLFCKNKKRFNALLINLKNRDSILSYLKKYNSIKKIFYKNKLVEIRDII